MSAKLKSTEQAWSEEVAKPEDRIKNGIAKGRSAEDVLRDLRARLRPKGIEQAQ